MFTDIFKTTFLIIVILCTNTKLQKSNEAIFRPLFVCSGEMVFRTDI
jgi:hypothetical protein